VFSGFSKQFLNIINPNQPWDIFSTAYKGGEITCLQWDYAGDQFVNFFLIIAKQWRAEGGANGTTASKAGGHAKSEMTKIKSY